MNYLFSSKTNKNEENFYAYQNKLQCLNEMLASLQNSNNNVSL